MGGERGEVFQRGSRRGENAHFQQREVVTVFTVGVYQEDVLRAGRGWRESGDDSSLKPVCAAQREFERDTADAKDGSRVEAF